MRKLMLYLSVLISTFWIGFHTRTLLIPKTEKVDVQAKAVRDKPFGVETPGGALLVLEPPSSDVETKVVRGREIQLRVYAEDGTYTLVDDTTFINRADAGMEFTSKWMVEK